MNQEILIQSLRKEDKLHQICREAEEHLNNLKDQKQELEEGLNFAGRWLPFAQRREKDWIADYQADIAKAQAACENAQVQLETYIPLAKEIVRDWLESEKNEEFLVSMKLKHLIEGAKELFENSRKQVGNLLRAITEARDAISVCSNHGSRNQSDQAEERIHTAIQTAESVDRAVKEINGLSDKFTSAAAGSFYDSLALPVIGQTRYELKLQLISEEKIGPALLDLEALLMECHRLHDEEMAGTCNHLYKIERDYEMLTDAYVSKFMDALLAELQSDPSRVTA